MRTTAAAATVAGCTWRVYTHSHFL